MQQLMIKHVDAFTTEPFGGNPAGVITDASSLTSELMQRIASEISLSETSFVCAPSSKEASFRIRFFTPSSEVDMSGHVLIAAVYALIEEGRIDLREGVTLVTFETRAGNLPVEIHFRAIDPETGGTAPEGAGVPIAVAGGRTGLLEKIVICQKVYGYKPAPMPVPEVASILGVRPEEITATGLPMEIISTGLSQLMVPIGSKETILGMYPDMIKLSLLNKKFGIDTNHVFTLDTFSSDSTSYSRHFAPKLGMWEDLATGTAAAGLGLYLRRHGAVMHQTMAMEQGREEKSLATILVNLDEPGKNVNVARIGGLAVTSITRRVEIDSDRVNIY